MAQGRVAACDGAAWALGVRLGMKPALVRSLAPAATLMPRDPAREAAALHALACWAGAFTPQVCVLPQGLALEIGGCLRLFGGFATLRRRIVAGLREQGFSVRDAAAPTLLGADWLARADDEVGDEIRDGDNAEGGPCVDAAGLAAALDRLPLARLSEALSPACVARLAGFGVHALGAARRLPGGALARRIGPEALALMGRAYGEVADPRPAFCFPQRFDMALELPATVEAAPALVFAGQRLVQALAGWLTARQAGVRECRLHLGHGTGRQGREPTLLALGFSEPLRDGERMLGVLRERLSRLELPAPVSSLRLAADDPVPLAGRSQTLFARDGASPEGMAALVERLRARLGDAQVTGRVWAADHRPEAATRVTAQGGVEGGGESRAVPPRPLWLLAQPQALAERQGRPQHRGPLTLLAGPERIESGWWDGGEDGPGDLRRDYYVALGPDRRWLWIYRDWRPPGGWFLHGYFS